MSDLVFPLAIAGAKPNLRRKPRFSTEIATAISGAESRASWWTFPRYVYTLSIEVLRSDAIYQEFQRVASTFSSVLGGYDTFLLQDPNDSVCSGMGFGVGDGSSTAFQLQRTLGGMQQSGLWDPYAYQRISTPRSNLIIQSQAIDDASYTKNQLSVTPNVAGLVAPDGTPTVDLVAENSATSTVHNVRQTATVPTSSQTYTFSIFVQAAPGHLYCSLQLQETYALSTVQQWFNLQTGKLSTQSVGANWSNASATIQQYPGNWYRLSITARKNSPAVGITCTFVPLTLDGGNAYAGAVGVAAAYLWGAQLEQGSQPGSYLPTLAGTVNDLPQYWPNFGDGFEPVTEVNPASIQVFVDGVQKFIGVDYDYPGAGLINFRSTPANGQVLTWSGSYFRRVRFNDDELELERIFGQLWQGDTIEFISVK